jgi:hypothetical protein
MNQMTASVRQAIVSTLALLAASMTPHRAAAQVLGYGIAGPAGYTGFFGNSSSLAVHAAGGGEILAGGRIGAAGEFGLLAGPDSGVFLTSANGVVHFVPSVPTPIRSRISPFVTGGYTRISSGEGGFDAWNLGAGADVWTKPRVGLRLEFRDHIRPDRRGEVQYWAFRVGVVFR